MQVQLQGVIRTLVYICLELPSGDIHLFDLPKECLFGIYILVI